MILIREIATGEVQSVGSYNEDQYPPAEFEVVGDVPETVDPMLAVAGAVEGDVVLDLDWVKLDRWEKVKAYRDAHRFGGCMTAKGRVDTDIESQGKVTGAVSMAMLLGEAFIVNWTMEDNTVETFNAEEMKTMGLTCGLFAAQCHVVGQALRDAINACTTIEELDAIDIEAAPWPS